MKRFVVLPLLFVFFISNSQVFNTSSTLKKGKVSLGIEPSVYIDGESDFNLFIHGGYGIKHGVDFGLKLGVLGDETYIGADVEFVLGNSFSLSAGAHNFYDFGLDGTLLYTLPIGSAADLYFGLDTDVVFNEDKTRMLLWLPIGIEIPYKKNANFLLETEICLSEYGSSFIGGGVCFFF